MKSLIDKILEAIRHNRPCSGRNIKATQTADGVKLDFVPDEKSGDEDSGGGDGNTPVEIAYSYSPPTGKGPYSAYLYGDGFFDDTGTPVAHTEHIDNLYIRQIATAATVPSGTILSATLVGDHYEADLTSRWL